MLVSFVLHFVLAGVPDWVIGISTFLNVLVATEYSRYAFNDLRLSLVILPQPVMVIKLPSSMVSILGAFFFQGKHTGTI